METLGEGRRDGRLWLVGRGGSQEPAGRVGEGAQSIHSPELGHLGEGAGHRHEGGVVRDHDQRELARIARIGERRRNGREDGADADADRDDSDRDGPVDVGRELVVAQAAQADAGGQEELAAEQVRGRVWQVARGDPADAGLQCAFDDDLEVQLGPGKQLGERDLAVR